jgi:hypothetical protein
MKYHISLRYSGVLVCRWHSKISNSTSGGYMVYKADINNNNGTSDTVKSQ